MSRKTARQVDFFSPLVYLVPAVQRKSFDSWRLPAPLQTLRARRSAVSSARHTWQRTAFPRTSLLMGRETVSLHIGTDEEERGVDRGHCGGNVAYFILPRSEPLDLYWDDRLLRPSPVIVKQNPV